MSQQPCCALCQQPLIFVSTWDFSDYKVLFQCPVDRCLFTFPYNGAAPQADPAAMVPDGAATANYKRRLRAVLK